MFLSLFLIMPSIRVTEATAGSGITVNIVACSDSPTSYVNNISNVVQGVQEAVDDANANTSIILAGEPNVSCNVITSTQALESALAMPRQVFIDAHGEVVPMPNDYFGPFVSIAQPSDGGTIYSNNPPYGLQVSAYVEPPPGSGLGLILTPWGNVNVVFCLLQSGIVINHIAFNSSGSGTRSGTFQLSAFGTYTIQAWAASNGILTCASVTINYNQFSNPGGGGGCPFISTWNGSQYALDNNLLAASEFSGGNDVTDWYLLQKTLTQSQDGTCSLLLSEFEEEHDYFDQVQLLAVDHSSNVNVAVSPSGEILTYTHPYAPVSAMTNEHENVKRLLSAVDGSYYESHNGSYVTLNFGDLNVSQGAKLVLRTDPLNGPPEKDPVHVQVQDSGGRWNTVATVIPRVYWSTDIVDLSGFLPGAEGDLRVRLCFTAQARVDFVGLDTSPQLPFNVTYGKLVSAANDQIMKIQGSVSDGVGATYSDLFSNDGVEAEMTPGHSIQLNFTFSSGPTAGEVRDFVFVVTGRYTKGGSAVACTADWQDWFCKIGQAMTNSGTIWANVAGYSCYYFGNSWYDSKVGSMTFDNLYPGVAGLQQVMGENVLCNISDGDTAKKIGSFSIGEGQLDGRGAFDPTNGAYKSLPPTVQASRPLLNSTLLFDLIGYVDNSNSEFDTVAITMNGTGSSPGIFIHSGLSSNEDDAMKGYIVTAMAIEEARANLISPFPSSTTQATHTLATAFSATMLAGGWGYETDLLPVLGWTPCYYVDLLVTVPSNYQKITVGEGSITLSLGVDDFELTSSDPNIFGIVDLTRSGWETGGTDSSFETKVGWWAVGLGVDTLGLITTTGYLGSALGLIPLLQSLSSTNGGFTQGTVALNQGVSATGIPIDPDGDNWGTVSICFRLLFPYAGTYTVNLNSETWLAWNANPRYVGLPFNTQLQFCVS
jgi:hypothetical protein